MAKVICTGGCGFIGSHVVDLLVDSGHDVTVIDNLSTGLIDNLNPKATFINGDIKDVGLWTSIGRFDYVFHLAALARIQPSIKDPVSTHNDNVNGTLNVLEYCRHNKVKLIFSSSSSIYAGDNLPTSEEDAKAPKNPYALQKWIAEQYIELYGELYGLNYAILRYFNVFGDRQLLTGAYTTVLGIFLNQKANGQKLTITGDGEQRRDFTLVADVAEANLLAMDWSGTFNIGSGRNYSVNEVAEMVGGEVEYIPKRPGEVWETQADSTKAKSAGWRVTHNSLRDYIAGLK